MTTRRDTLKRLTAIFIVVLLLGGPAELFLTSVYGEGTGDYPPPETGDWIITSMTNITDETIFLNGNIFVKNGGTLHLENVTIIFNSTREGEFKIDIENGGTLFMYNSTMDRGTDFTYGFRMLDGGKLRIENSEIWRCGFNAWNSYGITIYGDNAVIKNNLISQGYIGVYSYVASGNIFSGNTFFNNTHVGLYLHTNTGFIVADNEMRYNSYGSYFHSCSDGVIERNHAHNSTGLAVGHGIMAVKSDDLMIRDNVVNDTVEGLYAHTSTNITFQDNEASDNTRGIRVYSSQHVTIYRNNLTQNIHGVYADNFISDLSVQENNMSFNSNYNMYMYRATDSLILNNDIKNATVYYGLAIRESSQIEVNGNIITGNADRGMWFWDSNNITSFNNEIEDTNIGLYILRSQDNRMVNDFISHNNYGIYLDGSVRNLVENSTIQTNSNQDAYLKGASTELKFLSSNVDSKEFEDEESGLSVYNYLAVEMLGRTGPISGVDVRITETLTGDTIYSTPYFGGTDTVTDDTGYVRWVEVLFAHYDQQGSTTSQAFIEINDHGIYEVDDYEYIENSKTVTFVKSAITVDKGGNGDFTTIQAAIDDADSGDVILVAAGTYQETLVILKDIQIYGKGGQVTLDASGGNAFTIYNITTIANFTIINAVTDFDVQANTFVYNVSYSNVAYDASHYLAVGYYIDIYTQDENGDPISRASVDIDNVNWTFVKRHYESDPNGVVRGVPILDFADTATIHYNINPYIINATKLYRWTSVDISIYSNQDLILTLTRHGGFGTSITSGDFNNDGYIDYAVGAPFDDEGGEDAGAVFIYFGPQSGVDELRPIDADLVFKGERTLGQYGSTLETADINGDGLDDLIVGSPYYNATTTNGLLGWYWQDEDFSGFEYTRVDAQINFRHSGNNWDRGPPQVGSRYSINWSGFLYVAIEDDYTFYFEHDEGVRLHINDELILEDWQYTGQEAKTDQPIHLTPGYYSIEIEFTNRDSASALVWMWETPEMQKHIIPTENLFYTMDTNTGNGTVYVYSGEVFQQDRITVTSGLRLDAKDFPMFGSHLSTGDVNLDGKDDILVGFDGGTSIMYGSHMIAHMDFLQEPILSSEWDSPITGLGGNMYLSGGGILSIDTDSDSDAYAYAMTSEAFDIGFGVKVQVENGPGSMFLAAMDYKVPKEDVNNLSKQEDHTLFSIYANGQIKYWPDYGGNVKIENPNVDGQDRLTFEVIVSEKFDHISFILNGELRAESPLSGWDSVYLKLGDSTNFGIGIINVIYYTPSLVERTILGWENAVVLNNDDQYIATEISGETYLFSMDLDRYSEEVFVNRDDFQGRYNYTAFKDGLTLSPFLPISIVANGDFNDGWNNWTQAGSVRDDNLGVFEITTEERGDWHVYDGPTAGIGPDDDEVAHSNNQGKDNDGKLISDPFLITEDVKFIDFWHHVEWWSFERASESGWQDDLDDFISIRLEKESDGSVVAEQYYGKDFGGGDGLAEGRLQFDVSAYQGESLIFIVEMSENRPQSEDGIVQIDNVTGAKENEDVAGDFESNFTTYDNNFTAFIPLWNGDEHGGTIDFYYRTDEQDDWMDMDMGLNDLGTMINTFQFKIEITGVKGNPYPIVENLRISFINGTPMKLQEGFPKIAGPVLEDDTLAVFDGEVMTLYSGVSPEVDFTGESDSLSVSSPGDVDISGSEDMFVSSSEGVFLFLMNGESDIELKDADYIFTGPEGFGTVLDGFLAGSPLENDYDGSVYVLPMYKENLALVGLNLEDGVLIHPHTTRTLIPVVKNTGLERLENVPLTLEINADSYYHEETIMVSLDPGEEQEVPFTWIIPEDENVEYDISFSLQSDMQDDDNELDISVTTRYHQIDLSTEKDYDSVEVGGTAVYKVLLTNTGTLGEDTVTFDMDLPDGWNWWLSREDTNFTSLPVTTALAFDVHVETNSPMGNYPISITAISENATSEFLLDLETVIVDRDLIPIQVKYLREDGNEGIPITGENTTIVLTIQNVGTQDASKFNTSLFLDNELIDVGNLSGIGANSQKDVTFIVIFAEGSHTLRMVVDDQDVVREYNELNNEIISDIEVKPDISSTPFIFHVYVTDLLGENFSGAKIRVSSGTTIFENITNDDGYSLLSLDFYLEGDVYLVESISGELYSSARIAVYSEDVEANIHLQIGRYSFELESPARDKDILPGGLQSYILNITNTGDFDDTYLMDIDWLPEGWTFTITGTGYDNGSVFVPKDDTVTLNLEFTSYEYAPAHQRYEFVITTSSVISPYSVRDILLRASVIVVENISITTEDPDEYGVPGDPISHRLFIQNLGNAYREVTIAIVGDVEYTELNRDTVTVEPGKTEEILFVVHIPNLRHGTILNHEVYGIISGVGVTDSLFFTTYINSTSGYYLDAEVVENSLMVTNNGNKLDHLEVLMDTHLATIELEPSSFDLDMGETIEIALTIEMLELDIQAGSYITAFLSIYNGQTYFINSSREIQVPDVYNFSLNVENTTIKGIPGTAVSIPVLVINTGNLQQQLFFEASNSGTEPVIEPEPLILNRNAERFVYCTVQVPSDASGLRTITISALSQSVLRTVELELDLTVHRELVLQEVSIRDHDGDTRYTINLWNNGDVEELMEFNVTCGELDLSVGKIPTGESIQFHVLIPAYTMCPEVVTLEASSMRGDDLTVSLDLIPPPQVTIELVTPQPIGVKETVHFRASGDYKSYLWHVDGRNILGKEIYYNFTNSGIHEIMLTVTDTREISGYFYMDLYVVNKPPVITVEPSLFGNAGEFVDFDARDSSDPDGIITEFKWMIEGEIYYGPRVHYVFEEGGTYNVSLTVTDDEGATASTSVKVTVIGTTTRVDTVDAEELDMTIMSLSAIFLLLLIGVIAFMVLRMNNEESSLLGKLHERELAQKQTGFATVVVESSGGRPCPACGHSVPGNFKFCNKCGVSMEQPKPMNQPMDQQMNPPMNQPMNQQMKTSIFCINCGAQVPGKYKFCNKCGSPLDKEEVGS